jgi:hypothetical protein
MELDRIMIHDSLRIDEASADNTRKPPITGKRAIQGGGDLDYTSPGEWASQLAKKRLCLVISSGARNFFA